MPPYPHRHSRVLARCSKHRLRVGLLVTLFCVAMPSVGSAQVGTVLFFDDMESGFGNWSTTNSNRSGINFFTANSAVNSLYVRGDTVSTTSIPIDTRVPAIRIEGWIRRGSDSFSEDTDGGEDLVIEYLDRFGAWITLQTELGSGIKGEILSLSTVLAGDALHAGFRLRFSLTAGSGAPPANSGIGYDYYHMDDIRIVEAEPPLGLTLGGCEDFDRGLGSWSVSGTGVVRVTSQTANSLPDSLALYSRAVTATSPIVDLTRASQLVLRPWIRRGSDAFSENPDTDEDFVVEYLDDSGNWILLERFFGNGTPGQIYEPQYPLPSAAAHANFRVRFRLLDGSGASFDHWHVDDVCLDGTTLLAEWRFEDGLWTGAPGELQDATGNGLGGAAVGAPTPGATNPALGTDPGTCTYGQFNGSTDGFEIPHSPTLLGTDTLSYTAWIHPRNWSGIRQVMAKSVHAGGSGRAQMGIFSENGLLVGRAETARGRIEVTTALPPTNSWTHVALTFSSTDLTLYVDGIQASTTFGAATTLITNSDPFVIGKRFGTSQYFFDGFIDEVRVYGSQLSAAEVARIAAEIHDCPNSVSGLRINHDGNGVHCQSEAIDVQAVDVVGNVMPAFTGTITLDTQTATGNWSLVTGQGTFLDATPDDGQAIYSFDVADASTATFALDYRSGPRSVDVDAFMGTVRDDDSEGVLVFAPTGFTLTASALPNPPPNPINDPISTTTAGTSFPLHITAFGTTPTDNACGIIEHYDGNQALRFWVDYRDPISGALVPTVDLNPIATSEAAAIDQSVLFTQGQAQVAVRYKDVGRIALGVSDVTNAPTGTLRGGTNAFVSPPADFFFSEITRPAPSLAPNLGGATPTGPLFVRAGEPFRVVVEARDIAGSLTPSFGRETSPEGIRIASAALLAPSGGRNGTLDTGLIQNGTSFAPTATAGRFEGTRFSFDEVGVIALSASVADADYLGTGPVTSSTTPTVGRFAPARFEVAVNNPSFATTCAVGAFSWVGQPFSFTPGAEPVVTVTAVGAAGVTTENYRDGWWKITHGSLTGRSYSATSPLDESGLPGSTVDPAIAIAGDGTGTLTFSTGSGLRVARAAPVSPFDLEVQLAIDIVDEDATAYAGNPFTIGTAAPAGGIAFDVSKRFQYGRLRFDNAFGSELLDLDLNLRVQRFEAMAFVDDPNDSCTRLPVSSLRLTPTPGTLTATPQIRHTPLLSGQAGLVLSAPNVQGEVGLSIDLGPGGADLPWLRFDWPEDGNLDGVPDDDPSGKAVFGIWDGRNTQIYLRESY